MLYCLSPDIMNDLVAVWDHDDCKYDDTNTRLLVDLVPPECKIVDRLSLICNAASRLRNENQWQYSTLIARTWVTSHHPFTSDIVDLDFKYHQDDEGYWEYVYVALGAKKLLISKSMYSHTVKVSGGVPTYRIDDGLSVGEYTLDEIGKSNQYFKLAAVFPAEPRMFADDCVEYSIPYKLI